MSGIYTGAMGMISNMDKLNVIANNLANVDTTGYKYDQATFKVFDETLQKAIDNTGTKDLGHYHDEMYVDSIHTNFEQGAAKTTDSQLDFMLQDFPNDKSVSFFTVEKDGQDYLTRNGSFMLDQNRNLVTPNGAFVLDQNGNKITIPQNTTYSTDSDGTIRDYANNAPIAKMQIHSVNDQDLGLLEKKQGGFYQVMNMNEIQKNFGSIPTILNEFDHNVTLQGVFGSKERLQDMLQTGKVNVLGGFQGQVISNTLEESNVDMSKEMVDMMSAQRGVASGQKISTTFYSIMDKEANDIGK